MKIFIDTANVDEIREAASWGILSGVTTNPTLAARENRDYGIVLKEIIEIVDGPISAEVISLDKDGMIAEAKKLAAIHKNIVIKVPITEAGLATTKYLSGQGIKVNMTLVFSVNQAMLAAGAGAAFASPFLGRLDDINEDGMVLLSNMVKVYNNYDIDTQIIAASIRHPQHVTSAALIGVDIATIPFKVLQKMVKHPLTDKGIAQFLADWKKLQSAIGNSAGNTV